MIATAYKSSNLRALSLDLELLHPFDFKRNGDDERVRLTLLCCRSRLASVITKVL